MSILLYRNWTSQKIRPGQLSAPHYFRFSLAPPLLTLNHFGLEWPNEVPNQIFMVGTAETNKRTSWKGKLLLRKDMFALGTYLLINVVSKYPMWEHSININSYRVGMVGTSKNLVELFQNLNLEDSSSIHYRLPWHRNTLSTIKALT